MPRNQPLFLPAALPSATSSAGQQVDLVILMQATTSPGVGAPGIFGMMTMKYKFQFETGVPRQLMMILEKDHVIPILGSTRGA